MLNDDILAAFRPSPAEMEKIRKRLCEHNDHVLDPDETTGKAICGTCGAVFQARLTQAVLFAQVLELRRQLLGEP